MAFNRKNYNRNTSVVIENLETRKLMSAVNVADYGAKANDGIDDTRAIQNAINASRDGDTIVFGGGTFDVSEVVIKDNRTYTGGGTLKRPTGQGFIFKTSGNNQNVTIDNLTFDGGGIDAGNTLSKNMKVVNSTIKNISKGWPTGNGILVTAGAENMTVRNNQFLNIMGETAIYGFTRFHNVEITNNYFERVMEGVHFYYNGGDNLNVSNNTFKHMKRMCIEIQGAGATNTRIENNVASEWVDKYHESFFLSIVNLADGVKIRNNMATSGKWGEIDPTANNAPVGIEISGKNVLVEGNVIEGFREGMHLMNIRDAVVQNNTLRNQTWMGIWRTGVSHGSNDGSNLTIQNNNIYNPKVIAFLFNGRSTGVIRNNNITLFGTANEYQEGSAGALNNVSRPGNTVNRASGSPSAISDPTKGNGNGGASAPVIEAPAPIEQPVAEQPAAEKLTRPVRRMLKPSDLTVETVNGTTANLSWANHAKDAKGYRVEYSTDGKEFTPLVSLKADQTEWTTRKLEANKKYTFRVRAYNAEGCSTHAWSRQVTTPSANASAKVGTGLQATYYNDKAMTQKAFTRVDGKVNFDWGYATPKGLETGDNFGVRWSGQILIDKTDTYTFHAGTDDGVRLWVDGKLVINHWNDRALGESVKKIKLEGGRKYDIKLEYYENTGEAQVYLAYSSESMSKRFVPKQKLFNSFDATPKAAKAA